ncbi:MAG: STAS-like domain-containing protein [Bacteroidales bacterium]|nr:STAS-like domain-containing protein [Bacteroidales bacterium]
MNKDIKIKVATDFSRIPGARYPEEGDFSGKDFRQKVLYPALQEAISLHVKLIIDLDGTAGLGTSFLEESFGGLIRENHVDYKVLKDTIVIISEEDPDYKEEVYNYIEDAYEKENNN